ncbi:4-amino-4-deoxy-L-arabinose transferase [Mariprofundus ferrinatatus]|uniref:4-amino-4-deoxy-L-arabinose transferase n=1 Tax=Mariprofundus ferrinatatus TaxID=1921087 RepID=A0A2K8L2S6_9PROT|nr:glycosyltransferase family 39 protein [Mariprofundus ferrinatatus]ATX81553.1 4-amino-4-deoxy-L-arabinose transferase [Mariprofundus ferrinatatus]
MVHKHESILKQPLFWLLIICAVNFFAFLGGHTLWDVDEPNNAVCGREMWLEGNWWVPMFNGDYRFDKPILIYWLMIPLHALFGVNEWTARLPSAMAMTGLVAVIWFMSHRLITAAGFHVRKIEHEIIPLMAAGLFATALHIAVIARAAVPDPLLMLSLGFTLPALLVVWLEGREKAPEAMPRLLIAAYVAIGLGVLAKGPIAGLMPLLIMASFLTLMKDWKNWHLFQPFRGASIALLVAAPWYIAVGVLTDGVWLEGFIFRHNIERFTDPLQGHRGFPGLYILTVLAGWFPWSGLLAAMLAFGAWRLEALRRDPLRLFMLCWIGVYILFFSIASTQLPNYVLPLFPAAAFLMAFGWAEAPDRLRNRARLWLAWGALVLSLALVIGGGIAVEKMWPGEGFYTLAMLPVALVSGWWLLKRKGELWAPLAFAMLFSILLLTGWSIPGIDHHKISSSLAAKADAEGFNSQNLATFHYFQPSLLYYHGGRLPMLTSVQEVATWLEEGRGLVIAQEALELLPKEIVPYLIVHDRVYGMYARRWLLLVSLQPVEEGEEIPWPKH